MGDSRNRRGAGVAGAIVLIAIGAFLLLEKHGLISREFISNWWPAVLIIIGVWLLATRSKCRDDQSS